MARLCPASSLEGRSRNSIGQRSPISRDNLDQLRHLRIALLVANPRSASVCGFVRMFLTSYLLGTIGAALIWSAPTGTILTPDQAKRVSRAYSASSRLSGVWF